MNVKYKNELYDLQKPELCPHCHRGNNPLELWAVLDQEIKPPLLAFSTFRCTSAGCKKVYFAEYVFSGNGFDFIRYLNGHPEVPKWPDCITELKGMDMEADDIAQPSKFENIYLQSTQAENAGYDELAGMGYRKAIERLIKDWAASKEPDKGGKIKELWLGAVINQFFDGDIKDILERAVWLGNDQAHYKKLFEEFNIFHLKELIILVVTEFDREYKKEHYIKTIEKRK